MSLDVTLSVARPVEVFSANVTHNLNTMAQAVKLNDVLGQGRSASTLYDALWRPDEVGITRACQLVPLLEEGLRTLRADPDKFKAFNPANGWGNYDQFVLWVESYLNACVENGDAEVSVSR